MSLPPHSSVAGDAATRARIRTWVLLLAVAGGLALCALLAAPFLAALAWALALAVLGVPLQRRLEVRWHHPGFAATICVLVMALIVVAPSLFVGQSLLAEAAKGAELVNTAVSSGEWRHTLDQHPRARQLAEQVEAQVDLPGTAKAVATWLSAAAASVLKGSVVQLVGFALTFYLLFFLLRDRAAALRSLRALSPLATAETDRLCLRVRDTIYATLYGTLAVAGVQGLLGGLMFWWLGLPSPLLWGVVMTLLAIVPFLGAFVVWAPAAGFLVVSGHWIQALILSLWGALVVGTVDNFLRPYLVGQRLKLHTVLTFVAVAGGIMRFGPAGLILGPVALTVTLGLLEIWAARASAAPPPAAHAAPL